MVSLIRLDLYRPRSMQYLFYVAFRELSISRGSSGCHVYINKLTNNKLNQQPAHSLHTHPPRSRRPNLNVQEEQFPPLPPQIMTAKDLNQKPETIDAAPPKKDKKLIQYDISWIFPKQRHPTKLWLITCQFFITVVGLFSKFVLVFMNRTHVYNADRLIRAVKDRPVGQPLVTVSNHHSCFDDPGLWGVLPIRLVCNSLKIRWSMAAHDICFTNKYHSLFFMYGKCIPVVRGMGVYQDAVDLCIQKCALGHWVHVFPEGKVNMTKEEMRLKWGVGRIIYESPRIPIILPMWHEGMDEVLPNVEPYILQWRKRVTLNIGKPLDLNDFIQNLKDRCVPEPEARKLITDKIQDAFKSIRLETELLHQKNARKK